MRWAPRGLAPGSTPHRLLGLRSPGTPAGLGFSVSERDLTDKL